MSNSSELKCRNLYGQNKQNLGLYDTVKKDVFNKLRTAENDDKHIKQCLSIAKNAMDNFKKITTGSDTDKKLKYALENGAFLIDDTYNGEPGSRAITIDEYNRLTDELKEKARPVVPGDEVSYLGAFGMSNASHHGVYMGTNSKTKVGLVMEVDGMFPTLSHSEIFYTLIMMFGIGGGAGTIRCYRSLNEFTFKKDVFNSKNDTTDDDSTLTYDDKLTSSRNRIIAETPNLEPEYIYKSLQLAVDGLICKIWEYNPFTSNCEHFAKLCTRRRFETLQGLTQNVLSTVNMGSATTSLLNADTIDVPDLVSVLNFYNTNEDVLNDVLDDLVAGNEIKNKAKFTNMLKALVLIIQDKKNGNVSEPTVNDATSTIIQKEALRLFKKLHTYEINRPRENRLVTDESKSLMDDIFSSINEVTDEDLNNQTTLTSVLSTFNDKFNDVISKSTIAGTRVDKIKKLFEFSNLGGNLSLPISNPIGIDAISVDKFDDLSETFIGDLFSTAEYGGKRKNKKTNRKHKKHNKKTKKNNKRKSKRRK